MRPGATKRPVQSSASSASVRVPGSCTLAMSGPTTPTSAARSSPQPTSTSGAAGEEEIERLVALGGGDGAVAQRGVDGIDRHQVVSCSGVLGVHEVGEDAPQLDAGTIGAHVDLGGDVEREPPVDVLLLEQRGPRRGSSARTRRRRPAGRRRRGRCGAARCRCGSARRPPAARRSRARWCRPPARSRSADSPGTGRGTRSAAQRCCSSGRTPCATPGSSWLGNQWVLVTVMPNPSRSTVMSGTSSASSVPMVAACTNGKCAMSRKLSSMSPAPTRARVGRELVVQEAVGVGERQVEPLPVGGSGARNTRPPCSASPAGAVARARGGMWSLPPMAGIAVQVPSPSKHQPW